MRLGVLPVQGTFLRRGHDAVVSDIEARIAKWTLMPVGNGEGLQVLVRALHLPGACTWPRPKEHWLRGASRRATAPRLTLPRGLLFTWRSSPARPALRVALPMLPTRRCTPSPPTQPDPFKA